MSSAATSLLDSSAADNLAIILAIIWLHETDEAIVLDVIEVVGRICPGRKALGPGRKSTVRLYDDIASIVDVVAG